ncbi:MAG: flagellar filament capping protein FliD [Magnetococcales bacterium]|nr:flagellar filament capping protein FliD [Magnetococcales bacterium]
MALGSITFGGLASGLPSDIVEQLMQAEQTRLTGMARQKSVYDNQRSSISELKTKLLALESKSEDLQDAANFRPHYGESSDTDVLTVTTDSDALAASHTVVVNQLATHATFVSGTGLTDSTATLDAAETINFTYNGTAYNVALAAGSTLTDIAQTITYTDYGDDAGEGVVASVLYDGTNYRLMLRAKDSGDNAGAERITLDAFTNGDWSFGGGAHTVTEAGFAQTITGQDASLTVDGIAVTSTSNAVSDAITGVTLNLKNTGNVTAAIYNDTDTLKETLNSFIESYNDVVSYINSATTKGGTLEREGALGRSIISQLRTELNTSTNNVSTSGFPTLSPFSRLAEIGIQTNAKDGTLSLDDDAFTNAVSNDFNVIADVFTATPSAANKTAFATAGGNEGISHRLADLIDDLTSSTGSTFSGKLTGLDSRISLMEDRIEREEIRLEKVRERLTLKFANLEQMVNSLNSSGSSLTQALAKL